MTHYPDGHRRAVTDAGFARGGIRNIAVAGALASARRGYAVSVDLVSQASDSWASAALPRAYIDGQDCPVRSERGIIRIVGDTTRILVSFPDWVQPGPHRIVSTNHRGPGFSRAALAPAPNPKEQKASIPARPLLAGVAI